MNIMITMMKSCYIYNHSNLQYYGKLDQKEEFDIYKVACQLCLLLVTSAVLGGVIYMYVYTKNDLLKIESRYAILKVQVLRKEE